MDICNVGECIIKAHVRSVLDQPVDGIQPEPVGGYDKQTDEIGHAVGDCRHPECPVPVVLQGISAPERHDEKDEPAVHGVHGADDGIAYLQVVQGVYLPDRRKGSAGK